MRQVMDAQASRTAVDLNTGLSTTEGAADSILPDQSYLLYFFMQNYAADRFDPGTTCRYSGMSGVVSLCGFS